MSAEALTLLSYLMAAAGLGCFLWPTIQRLRAGAEAPAGTGLAAIRSRLWWIGFVLTALALMLQRMAASAQ